MLEIAERNSPLDYRVETQLLIDRPRIIQCYALAVYLPFVAFDYLP